jgi:undecaprenyl-diphosphatase
VDWLDHVFVALSRAGSAGLIWIVLALVLALVWRRPLILWTIVKIFVDRRRPHLDPLVTVPTDMSFPSGHSATSFAGAVVLGQFAPRYRAVFYGLATAIAVSRVYVGVHYPLDIVGGALLGAAVGVTSLRMLVRFPPRWPARRPRG